MTPEQEVERGLLILLSAGDDIDERLLELACDYAGDTRAYCIVVAPAKGLAGTPDAEPGSEWFLVALTRRVDLASQFARHGWHGVASAIATLPLGPGEALVVVTCPELTQLHKRLLPMVSARGAS